MYSPRGKRTARYLLRAWLYATAECIVIVFTALILTAGHVRTMPAGQAADAAVGPLHVVRIAKLPHKGGGYTLAFSVQVGMLTLLATCYLVQVAAMLLLFRGRAEKEPPAITDA
jgi:hypothetical protein